MNIFATETVFVLYSTKSQRQIESAVSVLVRDDNEAFSMTT